MRASHPSLLTPPVGPLSSRSSLARPDALSLTSPALCAAESGHEELLSVALREDAQGALAERDPWGFTPLHWAVCREHLGCARLLLDAGAAIDAHEGAFDQLTPLLAAASSGSARGVEFLLRAGARPLHRSTHDQTALMLACDFIDLGAVQIESRFRILDLLLVHGADPHALDAQSMSALHHASLLRDTRFVERLLEAGCDPFLIDAHGRRASDWARASGSARAWRLLLSWEERLALSAHSGEGSEGRSSGRL